MNRGQMQKFRHVCPRNCPSSCTMTSYIDNNEVKHITGDPTHPYTMGRLCAKGFSYIEQNNHKDRLKYPYYQKVKGSGDFQQITWQKAYELIINQLESIQRQFNSFLPLAFYKGTGNIGIHHDVTEKFFSSLPNASRVIGAPNLLNRPEKFPPLWQKGLTHLEEITDASHIVIWGANPAVSDIHLTSFLIKAKMSGVQIIVIDPLYTKTAELADVFIQLRPNTDKDLAYIIMQALLEENNHDPSFIKQHTSGFTQFSNLLRSMDKGMAVKRCDIPTEALEQLFASLKNAEAISYVVGAGLQKYVNYQESIQAIESLAAIRGDVDKKGAGLFLKYHRPTLFSNQNTETSSNHTRMVQLNELGYYTTPNQSYPIDMLWISCGNPLVQEVDPASLKKAMADISFVVTVDRFMTPTAHMSNLILPTTSHFEEMDIIVNTWHQQIALNEAAISPYFDSKSEWNIMTDLALQLKAKTQILTDFPIYESEEAYLNAQLNDELFEPYNINHIDNLKFHSSIGLYETERPSMLKSNQFHFNFSSELEEDIRSYKLRTKEYPFWLLTPHHPYTLNSQFHYLKLSDEKEATIGIHPEMAARLNIVEGDIVRVFNEQGAIQIKAVYSHRVPKDIVMIYQGWYPDTYVTVNTLISGWKSHFKDPSSPSHGFAFYDTFVNVEKI